MKKSLSLLLFTLFAFSPIYAADVPPPPKKEATSPQVEPEMPEAYKLWEKENEERAVNEDGRYQELWSKTLFLLIGILALLFIATWCMKRMDRFKMMKSPSEKSRIQVLEKKMLSPKAMLYLVEFDGQKIALSETAANGVQMIHAIGTTETEREKN